MKILSWNINGLRSLIKSGSYNIINKLEVDIFLLQEIKIDNEKYKKLNLKDLFPAYSFYSHTATNRKGYSGLLTGVNKEPLKVFNNVLENNIDIEARLQVIEFSTFYLLNVYSTHTSRDLSRLDFKLYFNEKLKNYINSLNKNVIVAGDLNVAHKEIDLFRPKQNKNNAGFTVEERKSFDELLNVGLIDIYRHLYPTKQKFTWWYQAFSCREKNIGWRIDYFLITNELLSKVEDVKILTNIYGSDHCPIILDINI